MKLPLIVGALFLAVFGAFSWAAYEEVRRSALQAAGERLERVTRDLADAFGRAATQRTADLRALAADTGVRAYVASRRPRDRAAALAAMRRLVDDPRSAAVELRSATGATVLTAGDSVLLRAPTPPAVPAPPADSAVVGPLRQIFDTVFYYDVRAVIPMRGQVAGHVVLLRRVGSSTQTRGVLSSLLGSEATFLLGNTTGDLWTDLAGAVPGPPPAALRGRRVAAYPRDGSPRLGAAAPVARTPWTVAVEFRRDVVIAPARRYLGRIALIGIILVVVGASGAWTVGHRVTERYRLLFASTPYPAWVYDVETRAILAVNAAAVRHYGYSEREFLAMTIKDLRPPEDVPALEAALAASGPGGSADGLWRHRRKDGTLLEVEISSHPLIFGGRRAKMVLAHDVTEQRQAEVALRASEERFRAVAHTATDGIVSADSRGEITYFNAAAERMFGYPAREAVGQSLTILMPERLRAAHRAGFQRHLATGEARVVGRTVELAGRRNDGTEFPIELSLAAWSRGAERAFTAVIRDITERKRAEEALKSYADQLETANAELDAFAYSVSHDLRAPLRSIDGFSLALLEDHAGQLDGGGEDYLRRVRAASQRMGALIDDLLRLSRITRAELHREAFDLSALALSVAEELCRSDPTRAVELSVAPGLAVEGDPQLLRVVLENLLGNAWKYTRNKPRARIEFGITERDGGPAYFVRDDGAGFDMAYAGKLFGAFQRLHSSAEFEGTGVGLATVQRIVHRHGGRVWAEGAVGRGAAFYFTLGGA